MIKLNNRSLFNGEWIQTKSFDDTKRIFHYHRHMYTRNISSWLNKNKNFICLHLRKTATIKVRLNHNPCHFEWHWYSQSIGKRVKFFIFFTFFFTFSLFGYLHLIAWRRCMRLLALQHAIEGHRTHNQKLMMSLRLRTGDGEQQLKLVCPISHISIECRVYFLLNSNQKEYRFFNWISDPLPFLDDEME